MTQLRLFPEPTTFSNGEDVRTWRGRGWLCGFHAPTGKYNVYSFAYRSWDWYSPDQITPLGPPKV